MKLVKLTAISAAMFAMCACGSSQKADAATEEVTETVEETIAQAPVVQEVKAGQEISSETPLVIDFNATWCGPCRQFKPVFDKVAEEFQGKVAFFSVDVDSCPDLAKQYNVTAIPQVTAVMPDGTQVTEVGYMDEAQFTTFVSKLLN